ncbi:hypothetical protein D9757_001217 [Collybiopsis confluens]|uniref:Uncharacterized protein n=1 Tax=Collybiopsis confluens TaxID=2823264 RepID=A0A8H5MGK6_9AGAR|nr:hypothetical protein D9757_001217 [Collybiopsis confluens]
MSNDGDLFDNDWINFMYSFPAPTLFNSFYALTDLAMASNEARVNGVVEKANNTADSEVACGLNAPKIYNTPIFREELPMPLESNENTFHMGTGTRDAATFSVFSQRNTFALESTSVNNPDFVLKKGGGQRRIREARFTCLYCPQRLTTKQRLNSEQEKFFTIIDGFWM